MQEGTDRGWAQRAIRFAVALGSTLFVATGSAAAASDVAISGDPTSGGSFSAAPVTFTPNGPDANINVDQLTTLLATNDVVITTASGEGQLGTLAVNAPLAWSSASDLTVVADGAVLVNQPLGSSSAAAAVTFDALLGASQQAAAPITVAGPTTVVATGGAMVTLDVATNDFGQSLALIGSPGTVQVEDANALTLAGLNATQATLTTGGPLAQTAPVNVSGPTTIDAGAADVILTNPGNTLQGSVTIALAQSVDLVGGGLLQLGIVTATGALDLSAGEIDALAPIAVAGSTTLTATGPIAVDASGNDFTGPVSAQTTGTAVTGTVSIADDTDLELGTVAAPAGGSVSAGGDPGEDLTQVGPITTGGDLFAFGSTVNLSDPGNDFDRFGVSADTASIRDANALVLMPYEVVGEATFTAGTDLALTETGDPYAANSLTLVADAASGSAVGPGALEIGAGVQLTQLTAPGPVAIYTSRRTQNTIAPTASIYGTAFTPGPEFVNSAREVWNTAFPSGTPSPPFTIFYKQAGTIAPPPPPAGPSPPNTTLTKTPKKKVKTAKKKVKVSFAFTSTAAASSFACTLDGKVSACSSPFTAKVKKGKHSFAVAASAAGKTDPTPATYEFSVKRKPK